MKSDLCTKWSAIFGLKKYHQIYNKMQMRYRLYNHDKKWKRETIISGKDFKTALLEEFEEEKKRIELKLPENTYKVKSEPKPESPTGLLPEPQGEFRMEDYPEKYLPRPQKDSEEYDDLERVMCGAFGGSEEKEKAKEQLKKELNARFEYEATKNLCPRCKSSVCHCIKEGESQ